MVLATQKEDVLQFRENRRHWTDGRGATLYVAPREDHLITMTESEMA